MDFTLLDKTGRYYGVLGLLFGLFLQ